MPIPGPDSGDPERRVDLVIRDMLENLGKPSLGADVVEPCGLDQGVGDGGGPAAPG